MPCADREVFEMSVEGSSIARRSDLDAVRSFAMLLGIALHAAMAYIGGAWMIVDDPAEPLLGLFVAGVHGFRMPLFFLLSGFFSAMLLQRRGLGGLIEQRGKRVLLPLVIGCLTVVPVTWLASSWAVSVNARGVERGAAVEAGGATDLWRAAATGELERLRSFAKDAGTLDAPDPKMGITALGWAVIAGRADAAALLLELGADPNAANWDGGRPLHAACFFGRSEIAAMLMAKGGDPAAKNAAGESPVDALRHDEQTTRFIANLLKVPVDFGEVEAGRERVRGVLGGGGGAASGDAEAPAPRDPRGDEARDAPRGQRSRLQAGTFFQHLWFLWFLCWLNAGLLGVVFLGRLLPGVRVPGALLSMPLCLVWVVPLTVVPQWLMHSGGAVAGFGPATSAGLVPVGSVLGYYAVFFGFGALAYRVNGPGARLGRWWWAALPAALVMLPVALMFAYSPGRAAAIVEDEGARRLVSALLQALYAWLATLGVLGLCESVFARRRGWVRYLSDSAYWQYLAHLPLVICGQALLFDVEMPTFAKFAALIAGCVAVLLVSYHLLVRRTVVGRLLNGPLKIGDG